jgi:hypothetical protein
VIPHPIPKSTLPIRWLRVGRPARQSMRSPVSSARRPRTSRAPAKATATAGPISR